MKFAALLVIATCVFAASAANHAVVVAGSNSFWNYRHQADVCHAYQILIGNGIPADNIVLMAYDDIANDDENPFKGKVFNKPTQDKPGKDVYAGCKIDYSGDDVTPDNFLAILQGDKSKVKGGNGKVLKSGADDQVFINFADHGAAGLIAFPNGELYADDLIKTFDYMTKNKMYKEMTFYLEACESGSMFENLAKNTKIYGVSAASPDESSWGTYCDPDDVVDGKHIGSCLGDLFSVNWMEDSDAADVNKETLQEQYEAVKKATDKSQVMQWGDLSFTKETIGAFIGTGSKYNNFFNRLQAVLKTEEATTTSASIDTRDAKLQYLVNKYKRNPTQENYEALLKEMNLIKHFDEVFMNFKADFNLTGNANGTTNFDCYRNLIKHLKTVCGEPTESALKHYRFLFEACQNHMGFGYEAFTTSFMDTCSKY